MACQGNECSKWFAENYEEEDAKRLNKTWLRAARLAASAEPREVMTTVIQVPRLAPTIKANPAGKSISPCHEKAMTKPVMALELWTRTVNRAPTTMPKMGRVPSVAKRRKTVHIH